MREKDFFTIKEHLQAGNRVILTNGPQFVILSKDNEGIVPKGRKTPRLRILYTVKIDFKLVKEKFFYAWIDLKKAIEDTFPNFDEVTLYPVEHHQFSSFEEDGPLIETILDSFPTANEFSLTAPFNDGFSKSQPYGIYRVTEADASQILSEIRDQLYSGLQERYLRFSPEIQQALGEFETLVSLIEEESRLNFHRVLKEEHHLESPYLCDLFHMGHTYWKEPTELWHFYHDVDSYVTQFEVIIDALKKNRINRDVLDLFHNSSFEPLKPHLKNTKITFHWHCTTSSQLSIVYTFDLNHATKKFLIKQGYLYQFKNFDDLALYQDGTLLFSSCTHERLCDDLPTNQ